MDWENKRRDREQGVIIDAEPLSTAMSTECLDLANLHLDETDWENKAFRYIL